MLFFRQIFKELFKCEFGEYSKAPRIKLEEIKIPNLRYLEINKFLAPQLTNTFFLNLTTSLTRLFLMRCDFFGVTSDAFGHLVNLEVLEMSWCKDCAHMDLQTLVNLIYLRIDVYSKDMPKIEKLNQSLQVLDYRRWKYPYSNYHDPIDEMITKFNQLKALSLNADKYKKYDLSSLRSKRNLRFFRMYGCTRLKSFSFANPKTPLYHSREESESESDSNSKSESESFSKNQMVDEDDLLVIGDKAKFAQLETIDLRQNEKLCGFQCFRPLANLKNLFLMKNAFYEINANMLANMPNLVVLDLSKNNLTKITKGTFDGCIQLKSLNLSCNKIKILMNKCFLPLSALENLNLCKNQISSFNNSTFEGLQNLKLLDLSKNCLYSKPSDKLMLSLKHVQIFCYLP